jgi:hypothetical protein
MQHIKEYHEFVQSEVLNEDLGDIWHRFTSFIKKIFGKGEPIKPKVKPRGLPNPLFGQHMLYLPHQQGPSGAAKIIRIAKGQEKLDVGLRARMLANMPSGDPGYSKVKLGKDKEAVFSFLDYQQRTWEAYKKEALNKINLPNNSKVKKAIDKIPNSKLGKDFLTTVAFKESSFDVNPKRNKAYTGLFQIGKEAWSQLKKINPSVYKGANPPLDPSLNARAGHDYLVWSYDQFEKIAKS